jgi:hypothetical protein
MVLGLVPPKTQCLTNKRPKISSLIILLKNLRYFDHEKYGHGPFIIELQIHGFETLLFYMVLGLVPPMTQWLTNGRPKISSLIVKLDIF